MYLWPSARGLGNKTKEMYYSLLSLKMISFVLFPQALQPSKHYFFSTNRRVHRRLSCGAENRGRIEKLPAGDWAYGRRCTL